MLEGDEAGSFWFRTRLGPHPFTLRQSQRLRGVKAFHAVAFFPWTSNSLAEFWDGKYQSTDRWKSMVSKFSGSIVVGGTGALYIFWLMSGEPPFCLDLEKDESEICCVSWALLPTAPLEPLIVFTRGSVVNILDIGRRQIVGRLRGHGGQITSIAIHPTFPHCFCTTSRDFSARIYLLTLTPIQKPNNPHWPPSKLPSLAGAAHGLHMSESEGMGIGRCVTVLMGGQSGGHRAVVLGAAFHPVLPLIATCGIDRTVKIWHCPRLCEDGEKIAREDKPLFSSSRIHTARILSVNWLSHDILVTHSAPAIMRRDPEEPESALYFTNGTVSIWRWLGLDRFFPPNQPMQTVLRGCSSDYQESSSYKLLSTYSLPVIKTNVPYVPHSPSLHVYQPSHRNYDPLLLFAIVNSGRITMMNATHFDHRKVPRFPFGQDEVEMMQRIQIEDNSDGDRPNDNADGDSGTIGGDGEPPICPCTDLPRMSGWDIEAPNPVLNPRGMEGEDSHRNDLAACAMSVCGRLIVGIGSRGTIWVWTDEKS